MKIYRRTFAVLLIFALLLAAAGCSDGNSVKNGNEGENKYGFRLVKTEELSDISSTLYWYEHEKTGAELVWLKNSDPFKVFAASYKTQPADDTGAAHIVEHALLGGSRKYTSNDIFTDMNAISTNAYMNALTYPDKTIFPIASRDPKDFANLTDLYLDSVFFPKIAAEKSIFLQEGWRYNIFDAEEPLTYSGVVYNEMRGAMSDPFQILFDSVMKALYPDTCYAYNSGGDPEAIPTLSYEAFLEFYNKFYHPSNLLMYFYGDVDIDYFLKNISEEYLANFEKKEMNIEYAKQSGKGLVESVVSYNIDAGADPTGQAYISYNINCGDGANPIDRYILDILSEALVDSSSAPIKNALYEEGIGIENGSFWTAFNQNSFGVAAMYAESEDAQRLVEIVDAELKKAAESGLDKEVLYAIINRLELSMREAGNDEGLKGIYFMDLVLDGKYYGEDPAAYLRYDAVVKQLKDGVENGIYEDFIKERLLNSEHRAVVTLVPQPGLADAKNRATEQRLAEIKAKMSEAELSALIEENIANEEKKNAAAASNLPKLKLSDIDTNLYELNYSVEQSDGVTLLFSEQPANGIIYANMEFDLSTVDVEKLPYAAVAAQLLTSLDTENYDYQSLETAINNVSGGVVFGTNVTENVDTLEMDARFAVQLSALEETFEKALEIVDEIALRTVFDDYEWIGQQIVQMRLALENELNTDGMSLGLQRVRSYFSPMFKYREILSGMDFLRFLQQLEKEFAENPDAIAKELKAVTDMVFNKNNLVIGIAADKSGIEVAKNALKNYISALPGEKLPNKKFDVDAEKLNEGVLTSSDVNYVVMAGNLAKAAGEDMDGASNLLTNVIDNLYLYPELRQKGGAYGAYSVLDNYGNLVLYTYRDPNIVETMDVFRGLSEFVRQLSISDEELEQMIIGLFKAYPMTPSAVASEICYRYLNGFTNEDFKAGAEELKAVTVEDLRKYGDYIDKMMEEEYFVVIGNSGQIHLLEDLFDNLFIITSKE